MTLTQIIDKFENKSLNKGYKSLLHNGYSLEDISDKLSKILSKKIEYDRVNEVLSFIYLTGETFNYNLNELCKILFKKKDYPGFLKQAYRFELINLKDEIEFSIKWQETKGTNDAFAWKVKFAKLYEQIDIAQNITVKRIIDEEESISQNVFVIKELKQLKKLPHINKDNNISEQIEFSVEKEKYVSASNLHRKCQTKIENLIRDFGYNPIETKHIDVFAEIGNDLVIVEVKSINSNNERKQIRSAVSQLYEYKYIYCLIEAELFILSSKIPENKWLIKYLQDDRKINLIYMNEIDELAGNGYTVLKKILMKNRKPVTNQLDGPTSQN